MLWRSLVILHRYLGVAVGLLMLMWFISGIVMIYVQYPTLSEESRLATLAPIPWDACCTGSADHVKGDSPVDRAQAESLTGSIVVRLHSPGNHEVLVGVDGSPRELPDARAIALEVARKLGLQPPQPAARALIQRDQWTVGEQYDADRPLIRFNFADSKGTQLYISSTSGRLVLLTTSSQRFWNWLGAVPHWLYPTILRSHGRVWTQTVIWAAMLGVFLTSFGLCLGAVQFSRRGKRKLSPYSGIWYWHHTAGLLFGVFALTWVLSGLFSMNPWGFLESPPQETQAADEVPMTWSGVRESLLAVRSFPEAGAIVSLVTAPLAGRIFWIATLQGGTQVRLDAMGQRTPLGESELLHTARRIALPADVASALLLRHEDAYYYRRHEPIVLPVFRAVANDPGQTRFYFDPISAKLLARIDGTARWDRWLFDGLHRWDFCAALRASSIFRTLVIVLLIGGGALSATGSYLAVRRILRNTGLLRSAGAADGANPQ